MRMWNRWNSVSLEVHEDGVVQKNKIGTGHTFSYWFWKGVELITIPIHNIDDF